MNENNNVNEEVKLDESNYVICSKCGKKYNKNLRCCMDCGNLNLEHPENEKMSKLVKKYESKNNKKVITTGLGNNMGNRKAFIIFNSIIFIILFILFLLIPMFFIKDYTLTGILKSNIVIYCFIFGIFELLFISIQILFMKTNHKWWYSLIPIYNSYVFSDIIFKSGWLFLIGCIPFVGVIFYLVSFFILGKKFDKNPVLCMLFPMIYLPIIAFSSSSYEGIFYIDTNETNSIEKSYKINNLFAKINLVLIIVGLIGITYKYIIVEKVYLLVTDDILVWRINNKVNNINENIDDNKYICTNINDDSVADINKDGTYYFYDGYFFNNSLLFNDSLGYIRLVVKNGRKNYYVTYSDNNFGIKNSNINNIKVTNNTFKVEEPNGVICSLEK